MFELLFPPPVQGIMRALPREAIPLDSCWDAENVTHVQNRIRKVPGYIQVGATLASAVQRLVVENLLNGDVASWAFTKTKIYEWNGGWTDRTHGAGNYTSGPHWITDLSSNRDVLLATNNTQQVQKCVPGIACVDLTGSPPFTKCYGVRQFRDFMLYWGTTEGGDYKETRIRWADIFTIETFTGGLSGSQDLAGSDFILDIRPISNDVAIIYRERSLWIMRWVGAPLVFSFEELVAKSADAPNQAGYGACSPFSVVPFVGNHEYFSPDAMYTVGSGIPQQYGELGRLVFHNELDQSKRNLVVVHVDDLKAQKYIYYPVVGATDFPNRCLIEDYEPVHGQNRAYWRRSDITPTGVGFWVTANVQAWNDLVGDWTAQVAPWGSAAGLPDQSVMVFGTNSGGVYKLDWGEVNAAGSEINCLYESGLYLVSKLAYEQDPKSGFVQQGKSVCTTCWVDFGSRGGQTFNVDIGTTDNPAEPITWKTFTIPANRAKRYRIDTWIVGLFFAYRVRSSGLGAAPEFGALKMYFVPDSEVGV